MYLVCYDFAVREAGWRPVHIESFSRTFSATIMMYCPQEIGRSKRRNRGTTIGGVLFCEIIPVVRHATTCKPAALISRHKYRVHDLSPPRSAATISEKASINGL